MTDSFPWREAFPGYKDEDLPGVYLRGSRQKEGLRQKQLSELTDIPLGAVFPLAIGKTEYYVVRIIFYN